MEIEIRHLPDGRVDLVVPKQPDLTFESASPKLKAFAASLKMEVGDDVLINGEPEMHLHAPDGSHVQVAHRQ